MLQRMELQFLNGVMLFTTSCQAVNSQKRAASAPGVPAFM